MIRECKHGYSVRHEDREWNVYCPGGSRWWNLIHRVANRLPVPERFKGMVIYWRAL